MISTAVFVGILIIPQGASALTITLTTSQLGLMSKQAGSCTAPSVCDVTVGSAFGQWRNNAIEWNEEGGDVGDGFEAVTVGFGASLPGALSDLSSYSTYELLARNTSKEDWEISLFITASGVGGGTTYSFYKTLTPGPSPGYIGDTFLLSLDLTSSIFDFDTVADIGYLVRLLDSGCAGDDPTSCSGSLQVAPIPEPATLLLFGTGLAGLGFVRRRKKA